jgi:hypothetical protein
VRRFSGFGNVADSGGEYTFTYDDFGNVKLVQDDYNGLTVTYCPGAYSDRIRSQNKAVSNPPSQTPVCRNKRVFWSSVA